MALTSAAAPERKLSASAREDAGGDVGRVTSEACGHPGILVLAGAAKDAGAERDIAHTKQAACVGKLRVAFGIEPEHPAGQVRRQPSAGPDHDPADGDRVCGLLPLSLGHRAEPYPE